MKNLCIIPARGGSKRIPRKNIKPFLGKPIIAYSIEAALHSGLYEEVMVSTDDGEISTVAKMYGASVPFPRSNETSNDFATTNDVINEVLNQYRNMGREFDTITCLYATAPFVTVNRLLEAYQALENGDFDSAFTCVEFSYPILRSLIINTDGFIKMKWPEYMNSRSQDLEKFYHDAGQFYVSSVKAFQQNKSLWGKKTYPIILPELEVQDLDTATDWALAEMKFKILKR